MHFAECNMRIGEYLTQATSTYTSQQTQDGIYYIHTDHLNTPRVITDTNNKIVWRWNSDPFGTTATNEDPDNDGTTFTFNLRFPGQYFDKESNLHYNYFRDYNPATGRYVQSDPIGLQGGVWYVNGNPLKFIDRFGLEGVMPGPIPLPVPLRVPMQSKQKDDGSFGGIPSRDIAINRRSLGGNNTGG